MAASARRSWTSATDRPPRTTNAAGSSLRATSNMSSGTGRRSSASSVTRSRTGGGIAFSRSVAAARSVGVVRPRWTSCSKSRGLPPADPTRRSTSPAARSGCSLRASPRLVVMSSGSTAISTAPFTVTGGASSSVRTVVTSGTIPAISETTSRVPVSAHWRSSMNKMRPSSRRVTDEATVSGSPCSSSSNARDRGRKGFHRRLSRLAPSAWGRRRRTARTTVVLPIPAGPLTSTAAPLSRALATAWTSRERPCIRRTPAYSWR